LLIIASLLTGCRGSLAARPERPTSATSPAPTPAAAPAGATASPAPSSRYGWLYFWRDTALLSLPADCLLSSQECPPPVPLLTSTASHAPVSWTADGRLGAVFVADASGEASELRLYEARADAWRTLLEGAYGDALAWSPDGAWLAFPSWADNTDGEMVNQLYVIRSDGSGLQNVAPSLPGLKLSFAWMDAHTLAFSTLLQHSGAGSIYLFSLPEGRITEITPWEGAETLSEYDALTPLPDGSLAFTAWSGGDIYQPNWQTFIGSLADGSIQAVPGLPSFHFWSPDGHWAVGVTDGDPQSGTPDVLTLFSRQDFSLRQVLRLETGAFQTLVWSPDSRYALVQGNRWWLLSVSGKAISVDEGLGISAWEADAPSWQAP